MSVATDRETPLEALLALLAKAREFAVALAGDPLDERILAAFARLPAPDREAVLEVIERDATWCRIAEQTADTTGITVRPNPQASLYVHVVAPATEPPSEPLRRDVDVIGFGMAQFVAMLPLFFQKGVHAQWTAAARALVARSDAKTREYAARLCREILALLQETGSRQPRALGGRRRRA